MFCVGAAKVVRGCSKSCIDVPQKSCDIGRCACWYRSMRVLVSVGASIGIGRWSMTFDDILHDT